MGAWCSDCCFPCSPEEKIPIKPALSGASSVQPSASSSNYVETSLHPHGDAVPKEFARFLVPRTSIHKVVHLSKQDVLQYIAHCKQFTFDEDILNYLIEQLHLQFTSNMLVCMTCEQLDSLLKCFTFEANKETLLKMCMPCLVDAKQNMPLLLSNLDFEVRRQEMKRFIELFMSGK